MVEKIRRPHFIERFCFHGLYLHGMAYVHEAGFDKAYGGDIVNAVTHLRGVIESEELESANKVRFYDTIAMMWGIGIQR